MAHLSEWTSYSKPDPEWETCVKETFGGHAPDLGVFKDIPSPRQAISTSPSGMMPEVEGVKEHDEQVVVRDGASITCRIHSPANPPAGGSPLVVIYHGGGWCIGGLENEELLCRLLASKLGATCVNVDYRLGPEHKFPAALNDCHDATKWAATNASKLGADPSKGFIIGGTSAGGNITAVVSHLLRDEGFSPKLTGCLLMIPAVCDSSVFPDKYKSDLQSWDQNGEAPILGQKACNLFLDNYIPDKADRGSQLFSPLLWKTGHADLPPSVFQICGLDPLRDEALVYERHLREDLGIKTKVEMYPGVPHGFRSIASGMKLSKKYMDDSVDGVQWLLEQK